MKLVPTSNCCKGSRSVQILLAIFFCREQYRQRQVVLLLGHAARHASRPPTPPRENRAWWGPRPRRNAQQCCALPKPHASGWKEQPVSPEAHGPAKRQLRRFAKPVGEHTTGACMGAHCPRLPCVSRLRLCRRGYSLIPQSFPLCTALIVEEVSPVIHHRLKIENVSGRKATD
jgi:hypothetical protein